MKKIKFISLIALLILINLHLSAIDIWISPNGSDINPGTSELPKATLTAALLQARELRTVNDPSITGGIHIILKGGIYQLSETVVLSQKDAGTAESPTFIEAAPGEIPVISGGVPVTGWQDAGVVPGLPNIAQNRIWVANTPQIAGANLNFRQLYVNNTKVNRASSRESINRLLSADKTNQNIQIPTPRMSLKNAKNMELTIIQDWELANLRIKSIDSLGLKTKFTFQQPESGIEFKRPWPSLVASDGGSSNQFFILSNAIELLNKPLEWYNDSTAGKLYYWPRAGQDKATAQVIAPSLETLIKIEGTLDSTASYIYFKGLNFEHTTWMRPSYAGHIPLQSGQYILDAYSDASAPGGNVAWVGRQSAGVTVKSASHINFDGCTFQHMGANGLDFVSGTHNDSVQGCVFTDIGGSGIQIGYFGDKNFEVHKAYNPIDYRLVCQKEVIKNNYLTNVTNEDWGCIGISVGYASDITISHNEIGNVNYSAISVGWGWTGSASCMKNNKITANYIHNFANNMQDVGAIYTLSTQPNSEMTGNRIEKKGDPIYNANRWAFFIYLDEGTDYYNVSNNWTETSSTNTNKVGSHNVWGTNGPTVSNSYKLAAGLESAYKNLVQKVQTPSVPPADSIVEYVECYTPLYETGNLVSDPECNNYLTYKSWGNTSQVTGANAYCGNSVGATGACGGSIDYSLTGKLSPNTTYRLRAMMFTNGSAGITLNGCGINGSTADYQKAVNTGSTWQLVDFIFTTGTLESAQNFWYNSCGGNNATDIRLDNFEIFQYTAPVLTATTSTISFEGGATSASFTVSGTNLTDAVTLTAPVGITLSTYSMPKNPAATSITVTYDGSTVLNDTIRLTSSGITVKIAVKSSDCFHPLYKNLTNMIPDPYLNDLTGFGGWGYKALVTGNEVYCGLSCVKFTATTNTWPDGAALNVTDIAWTPNSTYRLRAVVKTVDGSCAFLAKNTNPDFLKVIPQSGNNWVVVDTTFTTGSTPSSGFLTFNNVDGTGTNGKIAYIDNYELYNITSLTALKTVGIENQNIYFQGNSLVVDFELELPAEVEISVFNAQGMLLQKISGSYNSGKNHKVIDVTLSSGIYFVKMNANGYVVTKKLLK